MTPTFRRTTHSNALALSACLLITVMTFARPAANAAQWQPLTLRFDMPSQPLPTALVAFGELTGYSVLVSSDLTSGRTAAAVHGDYTPAEALQRLLAGTRLGVRFSGSKAFTLQALAAEPEPSPAPVAEEGQAQVPVPTYAAVLQRSVTRALCQLDAEDFGIAQLQRMLGKKTMEAEILKEAVEFAAEKSGLRARPCWARTASESGLFGSGRGARECARDGGAPDRLG